ncbi:MAG: type secretion system protein [Betaproteobacteria bacterium]|nr:type secretion system protein [Betaproteobacteria bacterium]
MDKLESAPVNLEGIRLEERPGRLVPEKICDVAGLYDAFAAKRTMPVMKLGDLLVEMKMLTPEQLGVALQFQQANEKKHLGEILVELAFLTREQLDLVLCQKLGIPFVDLTRFTIEPRVLKVLPEELVRKSAIVPLCYIDGRLAIAMPDPLSSETIERVRFFTQGQVLPVMANVEEIERVIVTYFGGPTERHEIQAIARQLREELRHDQDSKDEAIKETDSTLVRLVNKIITDAHSSEASDIHVEANRGRESVVIRFRNDGVLSEYLRLPYNFRAATISRLKIMANLDISERRRSQDGRINFHEFAPLELELRVVTVPTRDGLEDIVMRLLSASEALPVVKLGLSDDQMKQIRQLIRKPYGLILAAGPTGSGKTTTLHSLVSEINEPGTKIWTAENPIEITQSGLRQVQVNTKIGWDFATVMRAFLRADPDVIMVGEMRDQETAGIAVEASLTGHLVMSTLHTNSAPETVVRLLDMGIDPFSFSDSLLAVLAQRLARRLCMRCRVKRPPKTGEIEMMAEEFCFDTDLVPDEVIARWNSRFGERIVMHDAKGCDFCRRTGYRGRIGLFELLIVTPDMRQMMLRRASAAELRGYALRNGMLTLKQDGIEKCLTGETDLHEVRAAAF